MFGLKHKDFPETDYFLKRLYGSAERWRQQNNPDAFLKEYGHLI